MKLLDLSYPSPQMNLACDEVLLELCEGGYDTEILRFWESPVYFAVLGYSNKVKAEVHLDYCQRENIPVLRRASGGGTVLQGPGCLNYALILDMKRRRPIKSVSSTYEYVLGKHKSALQQLTDKPCDTRGISDLAIEGMKFSGNAQRRKKRYVLFHGTLLLNSNLDTIQDSLHIPEKKPAYRKNRSHKNFLMNLKLDRDSVKKSLIKEWRAQSSFLPVPQDKIEALAVNKYSDRGWNYKF